VDEKEPLKHKSSHVNKLYLTIYIELCKYFMILRHCVCVNYSIKTLS